MRSLQTSSIIELSVIKCDAKLHVDNLGKELRGGRTDTEERKTLGALERAEKKVARGSRT